MIHRRRPDHEDGSLLIEAVTGIGLLVVVVTAIAVLGRAAGDAQARADAHAASVSLAEQVLEVGAAAATAIAGDDGERLAVEVVAVPDTPVTGGCATPLTGDDATVMARVVAADRPGAAPVLLPGRSRASASTGGPAGVAVRVHVPTPVASVIESVAIRSEEGGSIPTVAVGDGCWHADVAPGNHEIVATALEGVTLIDATHVPHTARPPRLSVAERPLVATVALDIAGTLAVTIDAGGGRLPDDAGSGLVWTVVGDDRRIATVPGGARDVHPGRRSVAVSTCRNATAPGSTGRTDVAAGESVAIAVPLATVEVEGIGTDGDEVLAAYSTSGCGDGSTRRPVLRWEGGLADGMRVALPHGTWQLRLETATGSRLTSPVTVDADGTDRTVRL